MANPPAAQVAVNLAVIRVVIEASSEINPSGYASLVDMIRRNCHVALEQMQVQLERPNIQPVAGVIYHLVFEAPKLVAPVGALSDIGPNKREPH